MPKYHRTCVYFARPNIIMHHPPNHSLAEAIRYERF